MKKNKVIETRITGTVPGDIMISGDAETLSLSDLKPETVKQVAAELLEQEKLRNDRKLVNLAYNYGSPIFDLKSMGKPVRDLDEVVKQWREINGKIVDFFKAILADKVIIAEIHDEIVTESVVSFAERFGKAMLKKPFLKGEYAFKIKNYSPDNWPADAPPYDSAEGWEFEKAMKREELKSMLTIEWLEKQQTEKHALIAKRLREILGA